MSKLLGVVKSACWLGLYSSVNHLDCEGTGAISEPKSQIDQKCKDGNRYSMQMETKRELARVAIQISDKTVFK